MKTPDDKAIAFTFISHMTARPEQRWIARLEFPPGAGPETELPIEIIDGEDNPVGEGTFEFAGLSLPVRDGASSIRYADFVKGKHAVPLWLHRKGMPPVPGGLTFA